MEGTVNCKMFWRRIGQSLVKLKLIKACKQAITFLDIYPKSGKCTCAQRYMDKDVHCCIVYISQTLETTSTFSNIIDKQVNYQGQQNQNFRQR